MGQVNRGWLVSNKYSELQEFSLTRELIASCRDHTGLVVTIAYGLITITGILYLYAFFALHFGIPVLSFITIEDALLAGVREPLIIGVFIGVVLFQLFSDFVIRWQARTIQKMKPSESDGLLKKLKRSMLWVPKKSSSIMFGYLAFLIVFNMLVYELAAYKADKILSGGAGDTVVLKLEDGQQVKGLILLGSIGQYLICYDAKQKVARLYNSEAIVLVEG